MASEGFNMALDLISSGFTEMVEGSVPVNENETPIVRI